MKYCGECGAPLFPDARACRDCETRPPWKPEPWDVNNARAFAAMHASGPNAFGIWGENVAGAMRLRRWARRREAFRG
jgi:hypothetical protein